MSILYLIRIRRLFKNSWNSYYNKTFLRVNDEIKPLDYLSRFLNYDFGKLKGVLDLFGRVLRRIYELFMKCFFTFYYFVREYLPYLPQFISIILTFIASGYWISIVYLLRKANISLDMLVESDDINYELSHNASLLKLTEIYSTYRKIQAINSILVCLGILPYLGFSFVLSLFMNSIRLSKDKVTIYFVMFFALLFGYGIAGFMLFGDKISEYSNILQSMLQLTIGMIGGLDYESMKSISPALTPVFVFTFLVSIISPSRSSDI